MTMNTLSKIALITASVLSAGALTACQTTTAPEQVKGPHQFDGHRAEHHKSKMHREQFKKHHEQRQQFAQQLQKACDGKAIGQSTQVTFGEKTINGTCSIHFKADPKAPLKAKTEKDGKLKKADAVNTDQARTEYKKLRGEHRPMRGEFKNIQPMQKREPLTDAKRAELVKQFDQRLATRQAHEQALITACQGKKDGQTTQIKLGEKTFNGQCHVRFKPTAAVASAPIKAA